MKLRNQIFIILPTSMIGAIRIRIVFPIMLDFMDRVSAGSTSEGAFLAEIMMSAYDGLMALFGSVIGSLSAADLRRLILITSVLE